MNLFFEGNEIRWLLEMANNMMKIKEVEHKIKQRTNGVRGRTFTS